MAHFTTLLGQSLQSLGDGVLPWKALSGHMHIANTLAEPSCSRTACARKCLHGGCSGRKTVGSAVSAVKPVMSWLGGRENLIAPFSRVCGAFLNLALVRCNLVFFLQQPIFHLTESCRLC
jgi:hypothetical protein